MTARPGPKAAPTGRLGLSSLPTDRAARVVAFIERYCRTPKASPGAAARSRVRLRPWQLEVIAGLYGPAEPRQGLVSISRKNGKSMLAACLCLYHLLADGGEGAEVLIVSSDERTAQVVYNLARRMVELEPRLAACVQVFKDRVYLPATDSVLTTLSGRPELAQGRNPSFAVVDECHVCDPEVWTAMVLGQATRVRPLTLGISTECAPGDPANLMARLVEHGRTNTDPAFYFREFTAPLGCLVTDRDAWAAANPMLGDTLSIEHLEALARTTPEPLFRRYHLNQRVDVAGAWMPAGAWDACREEGSIRPGADVVLGVDSAYSGDFAGIVACTVSPRPALDVVALFKPAPGEPIDVLELEQAIRDACARYNVREVNFDPYRFERTARVLEAEGLPMVSFPQSRERMAPATTGLYEATVNRQLVHYGDADLAAHVGNAVVKDDAVRGYRIAKPSKTSPLKIDLAVCAILAHSRATFLARQRPRRAQVVAFR